MRLTASFFTSACVHTLLLGILASLGLSQVRRLEVASRLVPMELQATMPAPKTPPNLQSEIASFLDSRIESKTQTAARTSGGQRAARNPHEVLALVASHSVASERQLLPDLPSGSPQPSHTAAPGDPATTAAMTPQRQPFLAEYRVVIELFEEGSEESLSIRPADGNEVEEMPRPFANNPIPPYPPESLAAKQQGRVVLAVFVGADGAVVNVRLSNSSGAAPLDSSALSTVYEWRFSPARRGGNAVAFEVLVPIRFELLGGRQNVRSADAPPRS
ncbi:MAG: energy transducer TonB [Pirellulales bacterium]